MPSPYGTIVDNPEFHAAMFAEKLDRALRVDDREKAMRLITSVSNKQRQMMCEPYRIKYGKDLIASLAKKFSGDSENLVMALMETPLDYDVKQLKQATKGIGTDETALIEILCPRTTQQMAAIRLRYEQEYKKSLEQDVVEDTSGEFRRILSSLISGVRDDDDHTDDQRAREDAARLYSNDEGKLTPKSDPDYFHHVVLTSNQHQLKKMCDAYAELSGMNIEKQIEKEFSGDVRNAYLTIVRLAANRQKYFATQLYGCMSGPGTRDNDLIRTLVTRSEVDLELIKEEFRELYGDVLDRMIKNDTSGLYRDGLLAIVKGNRNDM